VFAVRYLHEKNIIHKDLKLENFLITHVEGEMIIKLIDFGMSKKVNSHHEIIREASGSPYYVAPEIFTEKYNIKVDIWALGVMLYIMIVGKYPFTGSTNKELFKKIEKGKINEIPSEIEKSFS
jgi:calcium-dependent protein kinase